MAGEITEQNREVIKQVALNEIEEAKREGGEDWYLFFNNFFTHLPDSNFKAGSSSVQRSEQLGRADLKCKDSDPMPERFSNLRQNQTVKEFHESILQAIERSGIDKRRLQELMDLKRRATTEGNSKLWIETVKELYEYIIPVFIELRRAGYENYDFTI